MAKFQKKMPANVVTGTGTGEVTPGRARPGLAEAGKYRSAGVTLTALISHLDEVRTSIEQEAANVASIEEERRREGETYAFDLALQRQKQMAAFAVEDEARNKEYQQRVDVIDGIENALGKILKIDMQAPIDIELIKETWAAQLAAERKAGEQEARRSAMAEAAVTEKVTSANNNTATQLAAAKIAALEQRLGELSKQNTDLMAALAAANVTAASLAREAFAAAGGVAAKGHDALSTAANAASLGGRGR